MRGPSRRRVRCGPRSSLRSTLRPHLRWFRCPDPTTSLRPRIRRSPVELVEAVEQRRDVREGDWTAPQGACYSAKWRCLFATKHELLCG